MKTYVTIVSLVALIGLLVAGCATAPKSDAGRNQLAGDAMDALEQAQQTDPSLAKFLRNSSGYAVFPHAAKGGAIVGGSYGRGTVYASGEQIGYADITQATVGLQAGGQEFREIVVFESPADLGRFKSGKLTSPQTSRRSRSRPAPPKAQDTPTASPSSCNQSAA